MISPLIDIRTVWFTYSFERPHESCTWRWMCWKVDDVKITLVTPSFLPKGLLTSNLPRSLKWQTLPTSCCCLRKRRWTPFERSLVLLGNLSTSSISRDMWKPMLGMVSQGANPWGKETDVVRGEAMSGSIIDTHTTPYCSTQETGAHMLLFEDFGESLSKIMSSFTSNDLNQTKNPTELTWLCCCWFMQCWKRTWFLGVHRFGLYRWSSFESSGDLFVGV